MKLIKVEFFVAIVSLLLQIHQCTAEGFLAGTVVKIPDGYKKIEEIYIGDRIVCLDNEKNNIESYVTYVGKKSVEQYACLQFGDERIEVACDQLFFDEKNNVWVSALSLPNSEVLRGDKVDVYFLGVARYHNYFVTKNDMCVHNFLPPLVAVLSVAFGLGSVELTSIGLGLAGLGAFLGCKWHKKAEKNDEVALSIEFCCKQDRKDIYYTNDAQAPGKPTENDGFYPPKRWDGKKKTHPVTGAVGWPDKNGKVWVPTGVGPKAHGGPHWDVQYPNGIDYDNVYPGGKIRPGR